MKSLLLYLLAHSGIITGCLDGDTCTYKTIEGLNVRVRLAGIDASELSSENYFERASALKAREFIEGQLRVKKVTLKQCETGRYNRPIVQIFVEGKDVGLEMIKKNHAAYKKKLPSSNRGPTLPNG